jgi:glycerol-3-phosphate acyltransferase PlsY
LITGKLIAIAVIAYLLGAIPFGLILGWLMGKIDITKHGSGNIGGTNVLRTVGPIAAAVVVVLDLGKAFLAVWLARVIIGSDALPIVNFPIDSNAAQVLAGIMVMVGHNWSVYINFRGGKGVAAYFGSWLAMNPAAALFGGAIIILTAIFTRYVSMGSIIGSLAVLILMIILTISKGLPPIFNSSPPIYLLYSVIAVIMIVYQHRSNISRLQTRTERRIDDSVKMKKPGSLTEPPGAQ